MTGPYGLAADVYLSRGWLDVLPLPPGQKWPPPTGFTGAKHAHVIPSLQDVARWKQTNGDGNLGLRMPPNVIGIDVDAYDGKAGAQSFTIATEAWGELPATWLVTSRTDGTSGIRFFRVPEGLHWPSIVGPGIEMIHRGHRYAVAWPSIHPEGGVYQWMANGQPAEPPRVDQLPYLPATWVQGLTAGEEAVATTHANAPTHVIAENLEEWETDGSPCRQVLTKVAEVDAALTGPAGSRHDTVRDRLLKVIRLGQTGHAGVGWAMDHIGTRFTEEVGRDRGYQTAEAEWRSLVQGGADVILGDLRPRAACYGERCEADRLPSLDLPVARPLVLDPFTQVVAEREEVSLYADLSWVTTGITPQLPPPRLMMRADGQTGLFYHGKINGLYGEPETAKTWLALAAIVEALSRGERAVFLDVDHNGADVLASRLVALGGASAAIKAALADPDRFRIALPEGPQDLTQFVADMREWAAAGQPWVAVVDSLGEVIPMYGAASKDNDQITTVLRLLARPLAQLGAAVILIDHVAKSDDNSGYAIGGTAKKRAINGSYIKAMAPTGRNVPRPGGVGRISLMVEKNRDGHLRRLCRGKMIGTFVLDSSAGETTTATIEAPNEKGEPTEAGGPAAAGSVDATTMQRILDAIKKVAVTGKQTSRRNVEAEIKNQGLGMRKDSIQLYLDAAEEAGCLVREQQGISTLHYVRSDWQPAFQDLVSRLTAPPAPGTAPQHGEQSRGAVPRQQGEELLPATAPSPKGEQEQFTQPQPGPRRKPQLKQTEAGLVSTETGEVIQ